MDEKGTWNRERIYSFNKRIEMGKNKAKMEKWNGREREKGTMICPSLSFFLSVPVLSSSPLLLKGVCLAQVPTLKKPMG